MMNEYYFLGTVLPTLKIGEEPEISYESLERLLKDNLSASDLKQVNVLRRFFDILNIRAFLKGEPLEPFGNLDKNSLEEAILGEPNLFPSYVRQFFDEYEKKEDQLKAYPRLVHTFYLKEVVANNSFLKKYLDFERKLRLILTVYRAKRLNKDPLYELQFENPDEEFIVQLLNQKDAKSFQAPDEFFDLMEVLNEHFNSPLELHKALSLYRFNRLDELTELHTFSFDAILAYVARYFIAKKWMDLSKEQGLKIVDQIIKGKS